jgi:hypothetical protein
MAVFYYTSQDKYISLQSKISKKCDPKFLSKSVLIFIFGETPAMIGLIVKNLRIIPDLVLFMHIILF